MRTIGVVTTSRADYGPLLAVLRAVHEASDLELAVFAGGMHLVREFGRSLDRILEDGFPVREQVDMLLASDTPGAVARSLGLGVVGFAQAFERTRVDLLVVLGDRFEMLAAAAAASPMEIPLAHIHGGEATFGALDENFRHAITKLSHVHFASTEAYAARLRQLGEEPWRVHMVGAPSLDTLLTVPPLEAPEFTARFGVALEEPTGLVTFHPVTTELERLDADFDELEAALGRVDLHWLFTAPNADAGGRRLLERVRGVRLPRVTLVDNLSTRGYVTALARCQVMVGNSSSGILEAPSFGLPVVNLGNRQEGRVRAGNVVDCACEREAIVAALQRALEPSFRAGLQGLSSPYGDGKAAARILEILRTVPLDRRLRQKRFHDLAPA